MGDFQKAEEERQLPLMLRLPLLRVSMFYLLGLQSRISSRWCRSAVTLCDCEGGERDRAAKRREICDAPPPRDLLEFYCYDFCETLGGEGMTLHSVDG